MTTHKGTGQTQHWAVTVCRNGEEIVTIESNCLSGRELLSGDEEVIRNCAEHLLSFVGAGVGRISKDVLCTECGKDIADPPSRKCPACQAYAEHQR